MKPKVNQMNAMERLLKTPGAPKAKKGDGEVLNSGTYSAGESGMKNKGKMFNAFVGGLKKK